MKLKGKKVAILLEQQFQDLEVWYPALRLREDGADVIFVGAGASDYKGKYGYPAKAHTQIEKVKADDLDALIVPGGWAPDFLRRNEKVLKLVQEMDQRGKVIGAICHAGWVLVSADVLADRTVTCFSAIKDDVVNAGAKFVDQEVVVDGNLVTSRTPEDLPAFCRELIGVLSKSSPPVV